jgi:hypothetical protein
MVSSVDGHDDQIHLSIGRLSGDRRRGLTRQHGDPDLPVEARRETLQVLLCLIQTLFVRYSRKGKAWHRPDQDQPRTVCSRKHLSVG